MAQTQRSKTVGDVTIHPGERKVVLQQAASLGGGVVGIGPEEAGPVAEALSTWKGGGGVDCYHKNAALLVGGPKHGEFVVSAPGSHVVNCISQGQPESYFRPDAAPTVELRTRVEHYYRADDLSVGLPFVIYEHSSVRNANVKRRAEQLDAELTTAQDQAHREHLAHKAARVAESLAASKLRTADRKIDSLQRQIAAARQERHRAYEDHANKQRSTQRRKEALDASVASAKDIYTERTQISHDYGI